MLIVVEGPSGVGKTSVAKALSRATYVSESEGSSPAPCLADFTRNHRGCLDTMEQFLLYAARMAMKARAVDVENARSGRIVVIDRFEASLYVLGTATLGLDTDFVTTVLSNGHLTRGLSPELIIFLDCPYRSYRSRAERRDDDPILDAVTYERQRAAFRRYFDQADVPALWVDTSDSSPERIAQTILAHLARHVTSP